MQLIFKTRKAIIAPEATARLLWQQNKKKTRHMAKTLNPQNWDSVPSQIQLGVSCRIETPLIGPRRARITRVHRTFETIELYGKSEGKKMEELLGKINTLKSVGQIQTTAAGGLVLQWFHPDQGKGILLTFPR